MEGVFYIRILHSRKPLICNGRSHSRIMLLPCLRKAFESGQKIVIDLPSKGFSLSKLLVKMPMHVTASILKTLDFLVVKALIASSGNEETVSLAGIRVKHEGSRGGLYVVRPGLLPLNKQSLLSVTSFKPSVRRIVIENDRVEVLLSNGNVGKLEGNTISAMGRLCLDV